MNLCTKLSLTSVHLTMLNNCKKPHSIAELMKMAIDLTAPSLGKS